jgi:hypothetical protein
MLERGGDGDGDGDGDSFPNAVFRHLLLCFASIDDLVNNLTHPSASSGTTTAHGILFAYLAAVACGLPSNIQVAVLLPYFA